jgi:hypothetical protein
MGASIKRKAKTTKTTQQMARRPITPSIAARSSIGLPFGRFVI